MLTHHVNPLKQDQFKDAELWHDGQRFFNDKPSSFMPVVFVSSRAEVMFRGMHDASGQHFLNMILTVNIQDTELLSNLFSVNCQSAFLNSVLIVVQKSWI